MEPSSSCAEHHEFLDVFLQPFSFKENAECHVKESSGKYGLRSFGSGEAETDNLVSRNLLSTKKTLPQDSSAPNSLENQELDQSYVSPSVKNMTQNSNQDPTAYSQERRKRNVRIGDLMNWAEGWEEQQGIPSVKCEKAHYGLHSATASRFLLWCGQAARINLPQCVQLRR